VEDNGRGITPSTIEPGKGIELIHKRVQELGGTCEIDSHPGQGTTVLVNIPVA
jgi:signal transduction histidine kinase